MTSQLPLPFNHKPGWFETFLQNSGHRLYSSPAFTLGVVPITEELIQKTNKTTPDKTVAVNRQAMLQSYKQDAVYEATVYPDLVVTDSDIVLDNTVDASKKKHTSILISHNWSEYAEKRITVAEYNRLLRAVGGECSRPVDEVMPPEPQAALEPAYQCSIRRGRTCVPAPDDRTFHTLTLPSFCGHTMQFSLPSDFQSDEFGRLLGALGWSPGSQVTAVIRRIHSYDVCRNSGRPWQLCSTFDAEILFDYLSELRNIHAYAWAVDRYHPRKVYNKRTTRNEWVNAFPFDASDIAAVVYLGSNGWYTGKKPLTGGPLPCWTPLPGMEKMDRWTMCDRITDHIKKHVVSDKKAKDNIIHALPASAISFVTGLTDQTANANTSYSALRVACNFAKDVNRSEGGSDTAGMCYRRILIEAWNAFIGRRLFNASRINEEEFWGEAVPGLDVVVDSAA
jgi:hypothetical protein